MADLKKELLEKLKKDQRGIKWFYDNYIGEGGMGYTTTYHQITDYIKAIPVELEQAIQKYLKD